MSVCFCWCCSRPRHPWAHHLCPRCATMNQHRLRPQWAWPFSLLGYFWQKCPGKCPRSCPHCVVAAGQVVELWKHSWHAQHTPPQRQPKSSCDSRVRSTPCDGTESDWDTHLGTQHLFSMECPDSPWQSTPWYLTRSTADKDRSILLYSFKWNSPVLERISLRWKYNTELPI